jgi:hypothetical protein
MGLEKSDFRRGSPLSAPVARIGLCILQLRAAIDRLHSKKRSAASWHRKPDGQRERSEHERFCAHALTAKNRKAEKRFLMIGPKLAVESSTCFFNAAALWHYVRFPTEPRSIECEDNVQERKYAMVWALAEARRGLGAFVFARLSPKVFHLSRTALRHAEDARGVGSGLRPSDLPLRNVRVRRNASCPTR